MKPLLLLLGVMVAGCSLRSGRINAAGVTVQGVKEAGKPATIDTASAGTFIPLPAGSRVVVTKESALLAVPAAKGAPAQPAQPAKEITEVFPAGPTEYRKTEETVKADTGTVDTSIAIRKVDAAESRPLLYASIASALAAGFFVYRAYPTPALCCGAASVVFFMSWRLANLPPWFYVLGAVALAGGAFLYIGHNRGLHEPVPTDTNK